MDIRFTGFSDSHDSVGRLCELPWRNLCVWLGNHEIGAKDGRAIACATFNGTRSNANVAQRTMVALDVETSPDGVVPPTFDETVVALTAQRQAAMIYTTHSHTHESPRFRIIMPLSRPVDFDRPSDPYFSLNAASQIGLEDVCDRSKFGAASLFFLPRHNDGAPFKTQEIAGTPIDSGILEMTARIRSEGVAMGEAERAQLRATRQLDPIVRAIVENYNATHPIVERLLAYGYRRDGNRFKSRYQHASSQGATTIMGDAWCSFSESDAHAGVGRRPLSLASQCAAFGDAFSLYVFYEHAGSFRAAVESLREATCQ